MWDNLIWLPVGSLSRRLKKLKRRVSNLERLEGQMTDQVTQLTADVGALGDAITGVAGRFSDAITEIKQLLAGNPQATADISSQLAQLEADTATLNSIGLNIPQPPPATTTPPSGTGDGSTTSSGSTTGSTGSSGTGDGSSASSGGSSPGGSSGTDASAPPAGTVAPV